MARSLIALIADGWVHKSMRSRSIVFFQKLNDMSIDYSNPVLVNFEYSRELESGTGFGSDENPENDLYRHPDRQGKPKAAFDKTHDLDALGTVLLEIGLGKSLAKTKQELLVASPEKSDIDPDTFTENLIGLASRELSISMGAAYASAVGVCLRGDFGVSLRDPNFSLSVLERVLEKLDSRRIQAL